MFGKEHKHIEALAEHAKNNGTDAWHHTSEGVTGDTITPQVKA